MVSLIAADKMVTEFEMSRILKRLVCLEIRKGRRWFSQGSIYAVVRGYGKHEVDNIGFGGLSFHYSEGDLPLGNGAYGLSLRSHQVPDEKVSLKGRTVSDEEVGELVFQKKKIKRCSVRFEPLNSDQKKALKSLINAHRNTRS